MNILLTRLRGAAVARHASLAQVVRCCCSVAVPLRLRDRADALQLRLADEQRHRLLPSEPPLVSNSKASTNETHAEETQVGASNDLSDLSAVAWEAAMCAALETDDTKAAGDVLASLERFAVDDASCMRVLRLCATAQHSALALALVQRLHELGAPPTVSTFVQAVRVCAKASDVTRMWTLLALLGRLRIAPEARCFEYCLQCCRNAHDHAAAARVWTIMRRLGLWPGAAGLQHAVDVHANAGQWRRARDVLVEAADAEEPVSSVLWVGVLAGAVRARELASAEELLAALERGMAGVQGELVAGHYNSLLHGYAQLWASRLSEEARVEKCEMLLREMRERGLAPDVVTYNCLLDLHRYDAPRVRSLLEQMQQAGISPNLTTYTKACRSLWFAKRPMDAQALFLRMRDDGHEPDARFYRMSISAAQAVGLLDDADKLHREAAARGLDPLGRGGGGRGSGGRGGGSRGGGGMGGEASRCL